MTNVHGALGERADRVRPEEHPAARPGQLRTTSGTLTIAIQAVVSADRRFVRLNLPVTLAAQSGATVPLFPITTFITPVFEGGSQGQPIPFTQFLQQPAFTTLNISTTVVVPGRRHGAAGRAEDAVARAATSSARRS